MNYRLFSASLVLAACTWSGVALAEETKLDVKDLTPWVGTYVSAQTFWHDDKAVPFLEEAVKEAKAMGKDVTFDDAIGAMDRVFHTDFATVTIDPLGFTYHLDGGKDLHVDYEYVGSTADAEGYDWYVFQAKDVNDENRNLSTLVVTPLHDDPEHFHFRYGDASGAQLMKDAAYEGWFPTMLHEGLTWEKYMEGKTPQRFAQFSL